MSLTEQRDQINEEIAELRRQLVHLAKAERQVIARIQEAKHRLDVLHRSKGPVGRRRTGMASAH